MIDLNQFLLEAILTIGLWFRSALVSMGVLLFARQFPRFAGRPLETAFLAALVGMTQLAAFPPMRIQGDWRKLESGRPADLLTSRQLDQFAFGIPPHFVWPGFAAHYISPVGAGDLTDVHVASVFDQRMDFIDLGVEMLLLGILMTILHCHAQRIPPGVRD